MCLDVLATVGNEEGPLIVSGPLACFREFRMQIDQDVTAKPFRCFSE